MFSESRKWNCLEIAAATLLSCSSLLFWSPPAAAQRADANVVTSAEEAFGFALGGQAIGIYNSRNVRGFNPVQLGNVRLNGLFIDRQGGLTTQLIESISIQVGNSAINYPFPAPSGIADFKIREPTESDSLSMTVGLGPLESPYFESDFSRKLGKTRSLVGGFGYIPRENSALGGHTESYSGALAFETALTPALNLLVFGNGIVDTRLYSDPVVYFNGSFVSSRPREIEQPSAEGDGYSGNAGVIANWKSQGGWSAGLGAFYSNRTEDEAFDQVVDVTDPSNATLTTFGIKNRSAESVSGEAKASYVWQSAIAQGVDFSVRARNLTRFAGNEAMAVVNQFNFFDFNAEPRPPLTFDAANAKTDITQVTAGVRYRANILQKLNVSAGVQRSDYQLDFASKDGVRTTMSSDRTLLNLDVGAPVGKRTAVYASYAEGLEEGGVAPADAANRYEVLPVLRSRQVDVGVRYAGESVTVAAGIFKLEKPLSGIDDANVFRLVGDVQSRGVEFSVTTEPLPGLTLLAGLVALDPKLTQEVGAGTVTSRPIGLPRRRGRLDLDYAVPRIPGLSFDFSTTYIDETPLNRARGLRVPSTTLIDVGVRKSLRVLGWPGAVRLQVQNVANADNWSGDSTGGLSYMPLRTFSLAFTVSSK